MKVVLATHKTNQWLGVNKYFYLLGKHLWDLGVDVTVIVDSHQGVNIVRQVCGDTVKVKELSPTADTVVSTAQYARQLAWNLTSIEHDILHCGHVLPYFYLGNKYHRPVIFQPFGNELFTLEGRGMNRIYCKLAQPVLRYCGEKADVLLAEGDWQLDDMRRFYPKAKRIEILPVGVDVESYAPKISHESHGLFQFLAVNSLLPYEGMDELLDAFKLFNGDCKLVIVGTGSEEDRLKQKAKYSRVWFKKNLSEAELCNLYRESDAFVCPTYETDVQMGVLEAMAMGLPVIARDAPWLPDSVIRFSDTFGLESMMFTISHTSPSKRAETAEKGFEDTEQYSFKHIAEKAIKIYKSLL
jgi:glycosyltransferase involved in cell wall biosynthesis